MIDDMTAGDIASLGIEAVAQLQKDNDAALALDRQRKGKIDEALHLMYGPAAADARLAKQKDSGTTHHIDGDYKVTCDAKPTVTWDQKGLAKLHDTIAATEDPAIYITTKTELTIAEVTYKGWPENIRKAFEPYRTVKVRSSYRIERNAA